MLYRDAEIVSSEPCEEGTLVHVRVGEREYTKIAGFVTGPETPVDRTRVP
jgi:hypothetical protein